MLFNFPAEILLMITDNLPIASLIQLALACKPLHAILFPTGEFPDLSKADKAVTLSMLAKDQPNMVVCFDCFRLRPFEYNDAIGWEAHRHQGCTEESGPYPRGRGRSATWHRAYNLRRYMWQYWGSRNEGTALDFSEVYSVMKRHFCGATHGLPLSGLRQSFSFERYLPSSNGQISNTCHFPLDQHRPGKLHYTRLLRKLAEDQAFLFSDRPGPLVPWWFEHRSDFRIINDELYLVRSHHANCIPQSQDINLDTIDELKFPICLHLGTSPWPQSGNVGSFSDYRCIPEIAIHWRESKLRQKGVGSCTFCYTDYQVCIDWGYGGYNNLALTTYHRLGSCQSPTDPAWMSLTGCDDFPCPGHRYSVPQAFGVGEVRRRWHESHGETFDDQTIPHWVDSHLKMNDNNPETNHNVR